MHYFISSLLTLDHLTSLLIEAHKTDPYLVLQVTVTSVQSPTAGKWTRGDLNAESQMLQAGFKPLSCENQSGMRYISQS